jgi:hypothetical protein
VGGIVHAFSGKSGAAKETHPEPPASGEMEKIRRPGRGELENRNPLANRQNWWILSRSDFNQLGVFFTSAPSETFFRPQFKPR